MIMWTEAEETWLLQVYIVVLVQKLKIILGSHRDSHSTVQRLVTMQASSILRARSVWKGSFSLFSRRERQI